MEQLCNKFAELIKFDSWGCYPKGYDRATHGPYDPSRYYGKPDTPFSQVKIRDLPEWFARREKGFKPFASLISRAHWRWQLKYMHAKKGTAAPLWQLIFAGMTVGYIANYMRLRGHRHYKYH
ncbi:Putative ATP synthase subunit f, mitochondrial [Melipona quadrifasciata]|uniref:Putative ATP synthase subunit f, mitochondrial n=1 Tax=Melipona quadrifasciata TaxID=166423 RepID=A0A0M9A6J5_9HYME|nr:Putative ATP synthase subunit f, mitochondrial [Melipona quadrifasciata]